MTSRIKLQLWNHLFTYTQNYNYQGYYDYIIATFNSHNIMKSFLPGVKTLSKRFFALDFTLSIIKADNFGQAI